MPSVTKLRPVALAFLCWAAWTSAARPAEKPAVSVEFRRAESKPAEGLTEAIVEGTKDKVYLHKEAGLTNKDVAAAQATTDAGDKPAVEITLTEEGQKKLAKLTADHDGKPLAILVDGKVIAAPIVRGQITGSKAFVSGKFTREEAERIARGIKEK